MGGVSALRGGVHDRPWPLLPTCTGSSPLPNVERLASWFLCFFPEAAGPRVAVDSLFAGRGEFRVLSVWTVPCSVASIPTPGGDNERGRCPQAQPPEPRLLQTRRLLSFQSLSHCELITDDGILHLSNSPCGHERLRVLELDNCLLITDVALEHLEHCRGLERLELYDCQQVTRAGIKRMRVSAGRPPRPAALLRRQQARRVSLHFPRLGGVWG